MAKRTMKVDNPLTLIAYFAGISESTTLAVIRILAKVGVALPAPLVWLRRTKQQVRQPENNLRKYHEYYQAKGLKQNEGNNRAVNI